MAPKTGYKYNLCWGGREAMRVPSPTESRVYCAAATPAQLGQRQ